MISRPTNAPTASTPGPEERYVNSKQLREIIPTSAMTLWRWQRDLKIGFPAPVKLGADGRNYWWLPKVHAWMRERDKRPAPLRRQTGRSRCRKQTPKTEPARTPSQRPITVKKTRDQT
jgi:predicted DNA-binding transcriptional regulator AlpA